MQRNRIITVEEHWMSAAVNSEYVKIAFENATPAELAKAEFVQNFVNRGIVTDLGEQRFHAMDRCGVDVQVLGYGNNSPAALPAKYSVDLCRLANDELSAACRASGGRLYGYAVVPVFDIDAAVAELERAVTQLGLKGVMLNGVSNGVYYDNEQFFPLFEKAAELKVPFYFHPGEVDQRIASLYYQGGGISPRVSTMLSGHGIAWHYDAGIIYLRLVLSGLFDKLPDLQLIIGHWGEMMPYYFNRMDGALRREVTGLKKNVSDYFKENMYVTSSGMFYEDDMAFCLEKFGPDRMLWSMDYPYCTNEQTRSFLEQYPGLADEDRAKIAYRNAEKLFRLSL